MKHKTINGWTKELMKAQIRLNMRAKSETEGGDCLYRSSYKGKPTACAVGCFIPDSLYNSKMDNTLNSTFIYYILKNNRLLKKKMPLKTKSLRSMQVVHDCFAGNPEDCAQHVCKWIDENVEDGE